MSVKTSAVSAPRAIGSKAGRASGKPKGPAFNVAEWRADLNASALQMLSGATAMLHLVVKARGVVEADTVREALQDAFATAYAATNDGVPYEAALKAPSVRNRVSEGMAVFNAETLPESMPNNLQHAAAAVRKAKAGSKPRQPKAKPDAKPDGVPASAMTLLNMAIDALLAQAEGNATLTDLIGDLKDCALDIAEALGGELGEVIEGELVGEAA